LLLEPFSQRSQIAYQLLQSQLGSNVTKDEKKPNEINVLLSSERSEFSAAETMLALSVAANMSDEDKGKTPEELFIKNTQMLFFSLHEIKNNNKKEGNIWWDLYVPFFSDLSEAGFTDVFCYYISASSNEKAREWLKKNNDKLEKFAKWNKGK